MVQLEDSLTLTLKRIHLCAHIQTQIICHVYLLPSIHKVITAMLPLLINLAMHVPLYTSYSQIAGQRVCPAAVVALCAAAPPTPPSSSHRVIPAHLFLMFSANER